MKCIVKGCENEAGEGMLCREHYDPEKKAAPAEKTQSAAPGETMSLENRLNLAAHSAFLVAGKLAGRLVRAYNGLFALTREERAQILEHVGSAVLRKPGRKKDSLLAFESAVKLDPTNPEAFRKLGDAYVAAKQIDKACDSYNKALELKPDYEEVYEALGQIYYDLEDYETALKCLTKARTFAKENDRVAYVIGLAYDKLGAFDKAVKFVETAVDLNPREPKYYYSLGFMYDAKGVKDKAFENFKKAVELEKGHAR